MRSSVLSTTAVLLAGLHSVQAQTFSSCNPMLKSGCPANPALGTTVVYDFTKTDALPADWSALPGTTPKFSSEDGLQFVINANTNAPTIAFNKYIMFGKVEAYVKASNGAGIVSSVILLSDTLDEIDWEWTGSANDHVQSNFFGKGDTSSYDREVDMPTSAPLETVHKYTIEWTHDQVTWTIDDNAAAARTLAYNSPLAKNGQNYPQTPMQVKLGNWVGCATQQCFEDASCDTHGTCTWVGGYFGQNGPPPYTMNIANITISDYSCGTAYSYGDMTGNFPSIQGITQCGSNTTSSVTSVASSTTASSTPVVPQTSGSAAPLNIGQGAEGSNGTSVGIAKTTGAGGLGASTTSSPSAGSGASGNTISSGAFSLQAQLSALAVTVLGLGAAVLLM